MFIKTSVLNNRLLAKDFWQCTVCKLNPDSEVGNAFNFMLDRYWCHVTRPLTLSVSFSHKIKRFQPHCQD